MNDNAGHRLDQKQQSAIADVVDAYGLDLKRFIESRVYDPADRDDIAQEVYLRLSRYEDIAGIRNPKSFLFRMAENVIKDRGRRAAVRHSDEHDPLDMLDIADSAPSPEQSLSSEQELELFWQALQALNPKARQAFLLSRVDGLKYKEIARQMGVSVKAVEKYMRQAFDFLDQPSTMENVGNFSSSASFNGGRHSETDVPAGQKPEDQKP